MRRAKKYIVTDLVVCFVILQTKFENIKSCSRMKFMNPLELEDLNKDNATLPNEFRIMLGEKIDNIFEIGIGEFENLETRKLLKHTLEELMGYAITNPCIVLGTLDANLTSMLINIYVYTYISTLY